jgi:hypothetical protein
MLIFHCSGTKASSPSGNRGGTGTEKEEHRKESEGTGDEKEELLPTPHPKVGPISGLLQPFPPQGLLSRQGNHCDLPVSWLV